MNRSGPFVDYAVIEGEPHRRSPVTGAAVVDLLNDFFQMEMKSRSAVGGFGMHGGDAIDRDRSRGVRHRGHRLQWSFGDLFHPVETAEVVLEPLSIEAKLATTQRTIIEPATDVVAVKKHDANAGIPSRSKDGVVEHPTCIGVAVGGVMDVMKLTDGGDAGIKHLLEGRPARAVGPLGIERCDQLVHGRPPSEERALALTERLAESPHSSLEGVTVRIDETGQDRH